MIQKTITLLFVLTLVLSMASAQTPAPPANASPKWYLDAWASKEQAARNIEARVALAGELLAAARSEFDTERSVYLGTKAYTWGSRDLDGYVSAADALNLIQQTDPSRRIWCLEQMAGLYETAYRQRPTKLRLGSGWGETLMELQQQRLDTSNDQFDAGQIDTTATLAILRQCQTDLQRAAAAFGQAIRRAEADAAKVRAAGHSNMAGPLERFAAEFRPKLDEVHSRSEALAGKQGMLTLLQGAENRYKLRPTTATADPLAMMYVTQFDKPERVDDAMRQLVSETIAQNVRLACRAPEDLTVEQATTLCGWYLGLITGASGDDAKLDLATRAAVYAKRAVTLNAPNGQIMMDRAIAAAATLGSQSGYFDTRTHDLSARLNWQYGRSTQPTPTVAATVTTTQNQPVAQPEQTPPTVTQVTTTEVAHSSATPIKGDVRSGRPMTICSKCGREFFAGWGDDHPTTCPRCSSGRKNIFDFGE